MSANSNETLPQEGTGKTGESLPAPLTGPGCPTYSGGGTSLRKTSINLSIAPELTSISQGAAEGQASPALASTSAEEVRFSKSKWKRVKSRRNKEREILSAGVTAQTPNPTPTTTVSGGGEARARAQKIKRQGTDPNEGPSQRPKAKRPNLNRSRTEFSRCSAREQNELAVTIHREDGAKLEEAAADLIKDKLADLIETAVCDGVPGRCLSFATSGLVAEGFFLVTPMTEEARDWLLGCDFGAYNGVPVRCALLNRSRVAVWIPTTRKMPADPLRMIKGQNDYRTELRISEWTLLHREMQPLGMRLVLGVPRDIISDDPGYVWLNFQATQVQARLIRQKARGTEKGPTHTGKATQTSITPTTDGGPGGSCGGVRPPAGAPGPEQMDIGVMSDKHSPTHDPRPVPPPTAKDESTRAQTEAARRLDQSESESG